VTRVRLADVALGVRCWQRCPSGDFADPAAGPKGAYPEAFQRGLKPLAGHADEEREAIKQGSQRAFCGMMTLLRPDLRAYAAP